jgi:hypothetical protein
MIIEKQFGSYQNSREIRNLPRNSESKPNLENNLSKVQFIKQLQDINEQVSNPAEAARLKAGLVGKWMQESPLEFFG